ncbi:hypothetical protein [Acetobacter sp.]|uniref:hypothetical protein n=1 Tax=Acetobacter sp. TaxID=440 RepID=UPI00258F2555|nr:hypothetical protein [Acetobacter sp.]MCC6105490.1 hypothetical protein [Acetobacter sp.]
MRYRWSITRLSSLEGLCSWDEKQPEASVRKQQVPRRQWVLAQGESSDLSEKQARVLWLSANKAAYEKAGNGRKLRFFIIKA